MSLLVKLRAFAGVTTLTVALGAASSVPALADWHGRGEGRGGWHGGWHDGDRGWHRGYGDWHDHWHGGWFGYNWGGYDAPGYWNGYSPGYVYAPPTVVYPPAYGYGGWYDDDDE